MNESIGYLRCGLIPKVPDCMGLFDVDLVRMQLCELLLD